MTILQINIVTNLMRIVTSKRELWPKNPIFLHKKHQNQPPNQKVVLLVTPFFSNRVKITTFFKHGLQNIDISSEKP
jgi:hypothetical protein